MRPLLIKGGWIIDPGQAVDRLGDVLIVDGKIAYAGRVEENGPSADILDAHGMMVCPGFVDLHCHLREPGFEQKETIATGTAAAARGGFTTVCCMPNTNPPLDNEAQLDYVKSVAARSGLVRVFPIACVTRGQAGIELTDFVRLSAAGAIGFSDDGRAVATSHLMRDALESARRVGLPVIDHCEDPSLTERGYMNESELSHRLHIGGMPGAAEEIIVARDLALAELTGGHIHIAHVSTEGSVDLIRRAKSRGVKVTAEVTPHHLTMTEEKVLTWGTRAKVNPPLRARTDVQAVTRGLRDGTIDAVATDHAPHTQQDKSGDFARAAFGISGFETAFGSLMGLVHAGSLTLAHLVAALTRAPSRVIRHPEIGTLKAGSYADVAILDIGREWIVDMNSFASKDRNSPLDGTHLKGKVMATIYGGKVVYRDDIMSPRIHLVDVKQEPDRRALRRHRGRHMVRKAILVLQDGSSYEGLAFGAKRDAWGEVVFNTSMAGYQEMLTDPSYAGQIVVPTYPLIGNYGTNKEDFESARIQVRGFVVRELCEEPSHFLNQQTLDSYLKEGNIPGIAGVDTRAITRKLRSAGVMMGIIAVDKTPAEALRLLQQAPAYASLDYVKEVSTEAPYEWEAEGCDDGMPHIVALDCGLKYSILRIMRRKGCRVTAVPCCTSAQQIIDMKPDGIILSPGPGDPELLDYAVDTVKGLVGRKPIMGICLGNQLIARAFGAKTFKLKFGHRGGNHPVRELATGHIHITAQNHGYAVDPDTLRGDLEVTHINLNDGTVEGLRHKELPIFCIQYHSEASPGPLDNIYLFDQFLEMVKKNENPP